MKGDPVTVPDVAELDWGVVANVAKELLTGPDMTVRRGLKHFAGGARVWVSAAWNGDGGERLWVLGRHRDSHRYIHIVVRSAHLENARAKAVYSPTVHRRLAGSRATMLYGTRARAEARADQLNRRWLWAQFDGVYLPELVDDPPPMEFDLDGTTYHLAHFNHNRARYSPLPPPVEP